MACEGTRLGSMFSKLVKIENSACLFGWETEAKMHTRRPSTSFCHRWWSISALTPMWVLLIRVMFLLMSISHWCSSEKRSTSGYKISEILSCRIDTRVLEQYYTQSGYCRKESVEMMLFFFVNCSAIKCHGYYIFMWPTMCGHIMKRCGCLSVRLSVCLSVCLSRVISRKRSQIEP